MEIKNKEKLNGKKILIATVAADGHINPLTGLAIYLKGIGCDVRWYTSRLYRERLNKLGIFHYPYAAQTDINGTNVDEVLPDRKLITDAGAKANFDMTHIFAKSAPAALQDVGDIRRSFPFDLVIADNAFSAIPLLKSAFQVPVIAIGVIPLAEDSRDLGPYGLGLYPPANERERMEFADLKTAFTKVVFKESIDTFSAILQQHGLPPGKSVLFDTLIKCADLYLQIGSPSFEFKRSDLGKNIRFIGSLLPYYPANNGNKWFDARVHQYQKIVLITQGTVEKDTSKLLEPTLEAFKDSDTLVIATTGGSNTNALKAKFPYDNIIIEDFIPFDEVMPYAHVYVTNGGYSGTLLSIKHTLPIVAAGIHEGKAEICARVGHFKYGIDLKTENPSPEAIRHAVKQVIADPVYQENVSKLAGEMTAYRPGELCAAYICELLDKNGKEEPLAAGYP